MNSNSPQHSNSFNDEFCVQLEYYLCETFAQSGLGEIARLWCDGIAPLSMDETQLTQNSINDTSKIITTAWIGDDGQDEYQMTLQLGDYSRSCFENGSSLIDCIPSADSMDWVAIDTKKHTIEIMLK